MPYDAPRTRSLQHVTATGAALAVALGPVVLGALLVRSAGGDPMASVNALIAGGGQRARLSRAHLRSCGDRVQSHGLRAGRKAWASAPRGPVRVAVRCAASVMPGTLRRASAPKGPQGDRA
ncbi:hypothetical protein AB0B30_05110 [Streptomyces narbonensis]|uniref:Uncharacterized protein n=1 Tax=Streptomyces narbonensis TaxID=67333 RepID=A0ABV3C6T1_9ACTN